MTLTTKQAIGRAVRGVNPNQKLNRNTFLWGPESGDPVLVKDLTTSHLANIINWIMDHDNKYDDGVLTFMIGEAKYRRLAAFAAGEPYVVCGEDGNYLVLYP